MKYLLSSFFLNLSMNSMIHEEAKRRYLQKSYSNIFNPFNLSTCKNLQESFNFWWLSQNFNNCTNKLELLSTIVSSYSRFYFQIVFISLVGKTKRRSLRFHEWNRICIPIRIPSPHTLSAIWYEIALREEIRSHIVDNTDRCCESLNLVKATR